MYTYDWERGGWVALPIGFQVGVVRPVAGQAFRFAVNPQYNLRDITGVDQHQQPGERREPLQQQPAAHDQRFEVVFTVTLLAPSK